MKTLLKNKKILCIPPLLQDNKYVTDFKKKAELFDCFLAKQCSILDDSSKFPLYFIKKTDKSIPAVTFTCDDIDTLIKNLGPNKALGHDMISILMLKLCGKSNYKPLDLIFQSCIKQKKIPTEWKRAIFVPAHIKADEQTLKCYWPVSSLPSCGKIFERLIYNNLFEYFFENNFISQIQSGVKPGDACMNQLLSITHEIYQSFDDGFEVRGVFVDISKTFDKVWYEGLISKTK